jgi:hypothetical protein
MTGKDLKKWKFYEVGSITGDGETFLFSLNEKFKVSKNSTAVGWVYIWVKAIKGKLTPLYVGKAGKTLKERFAQHRAGLRSNSINKKECLQQQLRAHGDCLRIYARHSPTGKVLGEKISLCESEEIAMIKKLCRTFNLLNQEHI